MKDINQHLSFIIELDKLKAIYRKALVKLDNNRFENSAEHSWHTALAAQILQQYAVEDIDIVRVMTMLLIHDIVEIDAGDLFAFSDEGDHAEQEAKEIAAARRIFGLLPANQSQHYQDLWFEFEKAESRDARFAKAIDRILPLLQNMNNDGGSWAQHKVSKSQVIKRNIYLKDLAPQLWLYVLAQIDLAVTNQWLIDK